ncbi:homeobox-containing protein 1-like [Glandiceps talaboti]
MEPRYTIEQIYLLKRLRQSGISKDEILCAMDTMEMLDTEFETRQSFMRPSSHNNRINRQYENRNNSNYSNTSENHGNITNTNTATVVSTAAHNNPHGQVSYASSQVTPNSCTYSSSFQDTVPSRGEDIGNGSSWQNTNSGNVSNQNQIPTPKDEEVTELIRKGTLAVKEEIKEFMAERKLSQSYVSQKTGISQSYISLFLVQGVEMKSHTQRLLYHWYIQEKKLPVRVTVFVGMTWFHGSTPQISSLEESFDNTSMSEKNDKGNPAAKKRERFVWKDACIPILEKYFQQNQYPDDYEREVIADACNSVIQIPGYELPPDKLVTPSKVYNWFCNKRKDQRRRKHIAELEAASNVNGNTRLTSPGSAGGLVKAECVSPSDCTIVAETRSNPSPGQDPMQLAVEMAAVNHSILALVNQHGDELSNDSTGQLKDCSEMSISTQKMSNSTV